MCWSRMCPLLQCHLIIESPLQEKGKVHVRHSLNTIVKRVLGYV